MRKIVLIFLALFAAGYAQLDHFDFDPINDQVAGQSFTIHIRAVDAEGEVIDYNYPATLITNFGGVIHPPIVDFVNGYVSSPVIITLAEDSMRVKCIGVDPETGDTKEGWSNYFSVEPGAPSRLLLSLPPHVMALTAGVPYDTLVVKYTDEWGNVINRRSPNIHFSSPTDSFAVLPPDTSIVGVDTLSITLRKVSVPFVVTKQSVIAEAEGLTWDTLEVRVNPGGFKTLLLLAPGDTARPGDTTKIGVYPGGKIPRTAPILAYQDVELTVYGVDECWNEVISPPAHECRLWIGGRYEVTPGIASLRSGGTRFTVKFTPTPPADLFYDILPVDETDTTYSGKYFSEYRVVTVPAAISLSAEKDTVDEGIPAPLKVWVTVDTLGEQGYPRVPVKFEVLDVEGSGKVEPGETQTDAAGWAEARFTGDKAGRVKIVATYLPDIPLADTLSDTLKIEVRTAKEIWATPNPFTKDKTECEIRYKLSDEVETVIVLIADIFGNLVEKWEFPKDEEGALIGMTRPGIHVIPWDGKNLNGQKVANGVYLLRIKPTGKPLLTHRIVVIR